MTSQKKSHLALFGASLIYGINYSVAKDVMPDYVQPFGFIFLRVSGALLLFWGGFSAFFKEKIHKKDMGRLALCGLFGVACNQLMFFAGLNLTTPINAAIIMTSNPIIVLVIAGFLLKEKITYYKVTGVTLGLFGALLLLFFKGDFQFGSETLWGDFLILLNSTSYALYLILVKPLMNKYQPITVIKWVFLFGFLYVAPVGFSEVMEINFSDLPGKIWAEILFVIIGTTFFAYLLNVYALKNVSPSVVSTYIYLQPVLATVVALMLGKDALSGIKIISALLIFSGVYLVSYTKQPVEKVG